MEELVREFLTERFGDMGGMDVDIETMPSGRVAGEIVWAGFAGQEHIERQRLVRAALKERFGAEAQLVGVLLAYTPAEVDHMAAA